MSMRAFLAIAGLLIALVQTAAAGAVGHNSAPRGGTSEGSRGSAAVPKVAAQKPKAAATPRAVTKQASRRILIYIPASGGDPVVDSGIGDAANCASYNGCTDAEYCIIWFLRCELVPPPVGTLQLTVGRLS